MGRREKQKSDRPSQNSFFCKLKIDLANRQKDLSIERPVVKKLVRSVLDFLQVSCSQVGIYFVTEKEISKLHDQFFNDPTPTDCISFPIDSDHLGEIFVCPSVAIAYAKKRNLDAHEETALYIVHGLLHLLGYDDLEEKQRRTMRKKEKSCMRHLNEAGISLKPLTTDD